MQTSLDMPFGDGVYTFRLPLPLVSELQRKTKTGIGALFARVLRGRFETPEEGAFGIPTMAEYSIEDLTETIRLALLGGSSGRVNDELVVLNAPLVQQLMDAYVYPARPLKEAWDYAAAILSACIEGYEETDPGKAGAHPADDGKPQETQTGGSITP